MAFQFVLLLLTLVELVIFVLLFTFFRRLRRSEELLTRLQISQQVILDKIEMNTALENDLMRSFSERQIQLKMLDASLSARVVELEKLLEQAEQVSRSPQFLRELIISGNRKGKSPEALAKHTGLSVDEVELILEQSNI